MVVITAPQSAVVPRGNVTLSWSPEYPQTAYEILYRRKGDASWSTMGREVSSSTSVTLNLEHFENFLEYHYRVVCYSENTEVNATIYDGNDTSAAYAIVVVPANQVGQLRVQYGDGMVEVPIYEDDNYTVLPKINTGSGGTIGVVENDEITASKIRVLDDSEKVMSLASSQANFVELHESNYAYMQVSANYQYYYGYNENLNASYTYSYNYLASTTDMFNRYYYAYRSYSVIYQIQYNYVWPGVTSTQVGYTSNGTAYTYEIPAYQTGTKSAYYYTYRSYSVADPSAGYYTIRNYRTQNETTYYYYYRPSYTSKYVYYKTIRYI